MWWMWLAGAAQAGDLAGEKICDDIFSVYGRAQSSIGDVQTWIAKDPRPYGEAVSACLCRYGAHPAVQQAARRHALRDSLAADATELVVATGDPITDPATQVATLFARRLEQAHGDSGSFVLHPVWATPPRWFVLYDWQATLGEVEAPGSQPFSAQAWEKWVYTGDLPPRGRLAELRAGEGLTAREDLATMAGTYDRVVWVDLDAETRDGELKLDWASQTIAPAPPHPEVAHGSLRIRAKPGPLVASCPTPQLTAATVRPGQRTWPTPRRVTAWSAGGLAVVSAGVSVLSYASYQAFEGRVVKEGRGWETMDDTERARARRLAAMNVGFGIGAIASGSVAVVSFALPGRYWR